MASILKVDTITGVSTAGSIAVTGEGNSTTTNLQQGLAKSWADTNAAGTTVNDSFNLSSLTDTATGQQTFNFSNSFGNSSYCSLITVRENINQIWIEDSNKATGSAQGRAFDGSSYSDKSQDVLFAGDLA